MIIIFLTLVLLVPKVLSEENGQSEFHIEQNDYNITPERVEVIRYNKDYARQFEIVTFKYNRTCTAFNITANFNFDVNKLEVLLQQNKFMSNEYRLFPLRVQYNVCKAVAQNCGGFLQSSCGNFTGCPMIKGRTYKLCNWTPNQSKFPPFVPSGRYKSELHLLYSSTEVAEVHVYSTISRPEVQNWKNFGK